MFELFDDYSSTIDKIIEGALKGASITDEFTNTAARLNLINDGLQSQAELQDKIFAAAERSRGSYADMADAVAKMGSMAGEQFESNDELIAFTELMQKGFKLGNEDTVTQQSAMRQLTQAMTSGRLQGDEFTSITEGAPVLTKAIESYMINVQKAEGTMKDWSSQGLLTADVIKNALFMAADDINSKFEGLPMTFADVWNKIKDKSTKAFGPVMESINKIINSEGFQIFINNATAGINALASGINWLINITTEYWDFIGPVLAAIGGYLLAGVITKLWAMVAPLLTQAALWSMINSPIFLTIASIGLAIAVLKAFGISTETILGEVFGAFWGLFSFIYNAVAGVVNVFFSFADFLTNLFIDPVAAIKVLFIDLALSVLGWINNLAVSLVELVNMIPVVELKAAGGLEGIISNLERIRNDIADENDLVETVRWDYKSVNEMIGEGYDFGSKLATGSWFSDVENPFDFSDFGNSSNPFVVEGIGNGGTVEVDMADENLQYLRDIAERDYINKFSTATLAPNVAFHISDIKETADVNKIKGVLERMMREEIAVAAEGAY